MIERRALQSRELRHWANPPRHRLLCIAVGLSAPLLALASCGQSQHHATDCVAIDGDTIKCAEGGKLVRLRLNGVDAAEADTTSGLLAWQHLATIVDSNSVDYIPLKQDKYGRTVAQVTLSTSIDTGPNGRNGLSLDLSCWALRGGAAYIERWDEQHRVGNLCLKGTRS